MESPGKIYLADQRGSVETGTLRRLSTFNFENYTNEHKAAFGPLFLLNDDFIAGGKLHFFLSKAESFQVFIPITGGIDIVFNGQEFSVDTGQLQILNVGKGGVLEISNPYPNDAINYLQIGLSTDFFLLRPSEMLFNFDFEKEQNALIEIVSNPKLPFKISAGRFMGRKEAVYTPKSPENKLFTFVLDGAFEIVGRLMHARDGLALWDTPQLELEALSNHAIVVVLEMMNDLSF